MYVRRSKNMLTFCIAMQIGMTGLVASAFADEALQDGRIGFVMTDKNWAIYQKADGSECPHGLNDGPREQFERLYPKGGDYTVAGTQLEREAEVWLPNWAPEKHGLPFDSPQSKIGMGLNLDGKVGENDFVSPDGVPGIDNQMYRAFGCTSSYRGPEGNSYHFLTAFMRSEQYNRFLIELTGVDSLVNDSEVTVTVYRGLDRLLFDAAGNVMPGATQRVDYKWGKTFIKQTTGKIVDGVLTSSPVDIYFPETTGRGSAKHFIRAWRLQAKISTTSLEGLMGGYLDIDRLQNNLAQNSGTHFRGYGRESLPSEYGLFVKYADGFPDAQGRNTAISSGWDVKFKQAFILHTPPAVANNNINSAVSRDIAEHRQ